MPDYLDFTEEKLELGYDYGAVGGNALQNHHHQKRGQAGTTEC